MTITKPCTVYVRFVDEIPKKFILTNSLGEIYYFRYTAGKFPRIKFNILHPDEYFSNVPIEVVKKVPVEIPKDLPAYPEPERNGLFKNNFSIVDNFSLENTPARIFTKQGVIEVSRMYYDLPKPIRAFLLLHEIGHFFYGVTDSDIEYANSITNGEQWLKDKAQKSEEKCDLFALINYLEMGYNRSMAFYALSHILKHSKENEERLKSALNNIQQTQTKTL